MTLEIRLLRAGPCPQCGAPVEFRSGSAPAQVCQHCHFVVVRTDRDFRAAGRVADLVALGTPLGVEAKGTLEGRPFRVAGRVQYDRAQAPGAPWEEIYVEWDPRAGGGWSWLAYAQGRWLLSALYTQPLGVPLPTLAQAAPGVAVRFAPHPAGGQEYRVTERGQRRFVSAEGELPFPSVPGEVEGYADLAGPQGAFATIDYDAQGAPAAIYFGRHIDPRSIVLSSGAPFVEAPKAAVTTLRCPKCGGNLPLLAPDKTERIACRYCSTLCDVNQGALVALKSLPPLPSKPQLELGTRGTLRGAEVQVLGFMTRHCVVDGERYPWREYLLYSQTQGFRFLLEEDGKWQHIEPISAGDVGRPGAGSCTYRGHPYFQTQAVEAVVDGVQGEFYWRVEVGERVTATEFSGPHGAKISEERGADEITLSLCEPIAVTELARAFPGAFQPPRASPGAKRTALYFLSLLGLWLLVSIAGCAVSRGQVVLDRDLVSGPTATNADPAVFSEPFVVPGGSNMKLTVSAPGLDNNWISADLALVNVDTGEVWEDSVELSYYYGVEGGESWTEGSRDKSIWYSRLPEGHYAFRVDPEFDTAKPARGPVHFRAVSGALPLGYVFGTLAILILLWFSTPRRKR